jgi:hypothetical protein
MKNPFILAILIATYSSQANDVHKEISKASKHKNVFYSLNNFFDFSPKHIILL